MKRPWLAATLNLIPGLGYLYLDTTRVLGWLLLVCAASFVIGMFDPSNNTGSASQGIWNLWIVLFFVCPYVAFIIDGFVEANKRNARLIEKGIIKPPKASDLPRGAVISPAKFVLLSIVTLNLYAAYWSWRLWETVRVAEGNDDRFTSSVLAVFSGFSNFALFPKIRDLAKQKGYTSRYPVYLSAAVVLAAGIAERALHAWLPLYPVFIVVAALVQLPIVQMQNHYMHATKGKNAPTRTNWGLIIFLIVLSAALVYIGWNQ